MSTKSDEYLFAIYLEEYKDLRNILQGYDEGLVSNTNFTLTAIGAVIALVALININDSSHISV